MFKSPMEIWEILFSKNVFDLVLEEWMYTFKVNTCEMSVKRVGHIKKKKKSI